MKDYHPEGTLINTDENKKHMTSEAGLALAQSLEIILEANVVMCDAEHNLIVELGTMKGIIPRDEGAIGIREGKTRDIALISRVGRPVCFIITDFAIDRYGKKYAVLSRRAAQQKCLNYILDNVTTGDIIDARITHLESFGAFCDVGCGNVALLPIDAISVSRISHPKDRFFVGDRIKAIIKSIDEDNKITLSHKELLGTWEENAAIFSQGQTVSGIVRSIENYGIFVELTPNLAGLAEPKENVRVGQTASVYIKSIIPEKMKIKLIIIDSFDTPCDSNYKYFYNEEHISEFVYSPEESAKQISTYF
ncbi:MAG: S1 RNA-binding domain-containing protein [Clostridia bacterium]|nr:S1 RNA-binding domain-containing protein [Clostridia bacterium]